MTIIKFAACAVCFVPVLSWASCVDKLAPDATIEAVGAYSNPLSELKRRRADFVYVVRLWRSDRCYFGLFGVNDSLDGEGTWAYIKDFSYDADAKSVRFTSKLPQVRGSFDFFEFSGKFDTQKFSGVFIQRFSDAPAVKDPKDANDYGPKTAKVNLSLEKQSRESMLIDGGKNTYSAWKKDAKYYVR